MPITSSELRRLALSDLSRLAGIGFGLRPFLSKSWSYRGVTDPRMDLGYTIPLRFRLMTLARWLRGDQDLFAEAEQALHQQVLERLRRQVGEEGVGEPMPIAEVDADINPAELHERFIRHPQPVIIRGLGRDLPAVKRWSKAFFERECGDTPVHAYTADYSQGRVGYVEHSLSLREAVNTEGLYLDTSRDVFLANPQLEDDIAPIQAWSRYFGGVKYLMSQAFLGWNAEGAPFHCANAWNLFIMVDGEKQWTWVDPEHTIQLGALVHPTVITIEGCVTGKGNTWRDAHPLYSRFCPRYTGVVRKGDVILNPPWWWHEIKNLSPFSIGVSSRWAVYDYPQTNTFFEWLGFISPGMWKLKKHMFDDEASDSDADLLRRLVSRNEPGREKYFEDFLSRSEAPKGVGPSLELGSPQG